MKTNNLTTAISPVQNSRLINSHDFSRQSLTTIPSDKPTQQQKKSIACIYIEQASIYFRQQNWSKAIAACKNALEIDANTADAYKILGNILIINDRKAEALGVYAKALSINPNSASIYANLGSFYAEQQNWQKALDYYQQAAILDPQLSGVYRSLARIWEELGNEEQALECLCQAINLDPEVLGEQEYFSFGQELYQQGKVREASIFYIQGVKYNPQAQQQLKQLVAMLEELGDWQQAVTYYHQLMALSQGKSEPANKVNKPIKNLLSRCHITNNKVVPLSLPAISEQKTLAPQIIETNKPDNANSWNNLGSLYAQKQQWNKAISCYQEALQLDANFAKAHRNLARAYTKLGEQEKAAVHWYDACRLEPDQVKPEEYFNLAKRFIGQQQLEKAIACLRRTIELQPSHTQAQFILTKLLANK
ncbi:group 1 glycosyl transferase [Chondrocystis sp. NIES-4102]|nr:group 1 glycosyl transferase [Chondrocystis sp. NIES-4102]